MKSLVIAWQGVLSEPLKSLLAVLALTLGMIGFVTVSSAQDVLEQTVQRNALLQGGPVATYFTEVETPSSETVQEFREQLSISLDGAPVSVSASSPAILLARDGVVAPDITIRFVDESYTLIRPLPLIEGSWPIGELYLAPRVALNRVALDLVDADAQYQLEAGNRALNVVISGVIDDGESSPNAYLDLGVIEKFPGEDIEYAISTSGTALTGETIKVTSLRLSEFGSPSSVTEIRRTDTISGLSSELRTTGQVLFVLALLSLASTIVGVANVGLSTVRTRAREYSLRRALGASRIQISVVTLIESQIVAVVAAAIAFALAAVTYPMVVSFFSVANGVSVPSFPLSTGLLCLMVASASGLVASVVPAIRASGPDVSSVMRV